jgi:hypothetical protein
MYLVESLVEVICRVNFKNYAQEMSIRAKYLNALSESKVIPVSHRGGL